LPNFDKNDHFLRQKFIQRSKKFLKTQKDMRKVLYTFKAIKITFIFFLQNFWF